MTASAKTGYDDAVHYRQEYALQLTELDRCLRDARLRSVRWAETAYLQGKRQNFELVKRLQRKDGQLIWIQLYVFRIADRASTGRHTFGMVFVITEKMQAQDALQAAHAELARSGQRPSFAVTSRQ
jgi:PAS domain S-box-containing protein